MVDCGCKKIQVKKKRRRSDGEKKYGRHYRPYLIQRVLAAPLFKIQLPVLDVLLHPTLYTLHQILPYLLIQSVQNLLLYLFAAFEAGDAASTFIKERVARVIEELHNLLHIA